MYEIKWMLRPVVAVSLVGLILCASRVKAQDAQFAGSTDSSQPIFTLKVEGRLVDIPFRVLEKGGKPVTTLTTQDLEVYENGVLTPKFRLNSEEAKINLVLLADLSGSMDDHVSQLKSALWDFVQTARPQDSITLIPFSETAVPVTKFETDRNKIYNAIQKIQIIGVEHTFQVIKATEEVLLKPHYGERNVIVILTDGNERGSLEMFPLAMQAVLEQGAVVFPVICSGEHEQIKKFSQLAQASGGDLIHAGGIDSLKEAYDQITKKLRAQYSVSFSPSIRRGTEHIWHTVDIRVKGKDDYRVLSRRGYCPQIPCQMANGELLGKAPDGIQEAFQLSKGFPADFVDEELAGQTFRVRERIMLSDSEPYKAVDGKTVEDKGDILKNECFVARPQSEDGRELKIETDSLCTLVGKGQYGYWPGPVPPLPGYYAAQMKFALSCRAPGRANDTSPLEITCRWPSRLLAEDFFMRASTLLRPVLEAKGKALSSKGVSP